jgi:hypothetical protein
MTRAQKNVMWVLWVWALLLLAMVMAGCKTPQGSANSEVRSATPPLPPAPPTNSVAKVQRPLASVFVLPAPNITSDRIAVSASGLHAFAWSPTYGPNYVTFFHDTNDVTDVLIPGGGLSFIKPEVAFAGTNLIIADCSNGGAGPAMAWRYSFDGTTLALIDQFTYGNTSTRTGCSAQTHDGFVAINYCTFGLNQASMAFDVACFKGPSRTGQEAWGTARFTIPNSTPGALGAEMDAVEMDGKVYAFWMLDSSGQVGLSVYDCSGTNIAMVFSQADFIPRNAGLAAPSIEIPMVNAVKDPNQDRIILGYQNAQSTYQKSCTDPAGNRITGPSTITAVYPDRTFSAIAVYPWDYFHDEGEMIALWPRLDGIHTYSSRCDTNSCEVTWRQAVAKQGGVAFNPALDDPNGELMSFSGDGYLVTRPYRLQRLVGAAPVVTSWSRSAPAAPSQFAVTNLTIIGTNLSLTWSVPAISTSRSSPFQPWMKMADGPWLPCGAPTAANSVTIPVPAGRALFRVSISQ